MIVKWQIKYSKGNHKMITIRENVALGLEKGSIMRHTSALSVRFVKQLAWVQMICPHQGYLSRWQVLQHHRSNTYRDYCCLGTYLMIS